MVSLFAPGLSLAFPFREQNRKLLPFSISVLGFFFSRPDGEGNNREGLNTLFSFNEFCTCPKSLLRRKTLANFNLYSSNKGSYGQWGKGE